MTASPRRSGSVGLPSRRVLLGGMLGMGACGLGRPRPARATGVGADEIVLGTHLDLTGPLAAGMDHLRNGTQMRLDEANEAGGIHGRRLRLIAEDNAGRPDAALRAAEALVARDEVLAIVNAFGAGANAAVLRRATAAGMLVYAPWGPSAVLQRLAGGSPWLFTTLPNYDTTTAAALRWMRESFKPARIGAVLQEGPLGDLVGAGVRLALALAQPIAAEHRLAQGGDPAPAVTRMKAAGVDLVVVGCVVDDAARLAIALREQAPDPDALRMLTAWPGRSPLLPAVAGEAAEGMYGVAPWRGLDPLAAPEDELSAWAAGYRRRFGLPPDEAALLAYVYAHWFLTALEAAGPEPTREKVAEALRKGTFTHPAFPDAKAFQRNHLAPESVHMARVRNGAWTPASQLLAAD